MKILCIDFDPQKATQISKGMKDLLRRCYFDWQGFLSNPRKVKGLIDDFEKATLKKDSKKILQVLKELAKLQKSSEKEWFDQCYENFLQDKKRLEDALYE